MNLYNSQNQQIEPFTVGDKDVTLFVGGITPYNTAHLGHAFTYCVADVLMRYLEMQGYHVTFVQNSGQPLPKDRQELNNKQTYYVSEDMQALNVRLPDIAHFDLSETVDIQISEAHEVGTEQRPFSRFWLHTTLVAHKGEKMSKSLGNLVLVRDLLQYHTVDALRLYLAQHHYRQPWSYDEASLTRVAYSLVCGKIEGGFNGRYQVLSD